MTKCCIFLFLFTLPPLIAESEKPRKLESFSITIASFFGHRAEYVFDGQILVSNLDGEKTNKKLSPKENKQIQQSIQKAPLRKWTDFWFTMTLDGFILRSKFTIDGKNHTFEGLNGCPPGFGKLTDTLSEITGNPLYLKGWSEDERNSEQKKGTLESWGTLSKRNLKNAGKRKKRRQRSKNTKRQKNPTDCTVGFLKI